MREQGKGTHSVDNTDHDSKWNLERLWKMKILETDVKHRLDQCMKKQVGSTHYKNECKLDSKNCNR